MKRNREKGFTLIELIVVIAVLAILAGVAVPKFISITGDAKVAADKADAGAVRTGILLKAASDAGAAKASALTYPTTLDASGTIFANVLELSSAKDLVDRGWASSAADTYTSPGGSTYKYTSSTGEFTKQ